jgi:uncharacterized protein (TIGR03437 family)
VPVARAAPALFASGGLAIAANQDGTLNSAANPAPRGSIVVFYGTGEGLAGGETSLRIGAYEAEVIWAGPVDGYPGLFQINARVPAGFAPTGTLKAVWTAGDVASPDGPAIVLH